MMFIECQFLLSRFSDTDANRLALTSRRRLYRPVNFPALSFPLALFAFSIGHFKAQLR